MWQRQTCRQIEQVVAASTTEHDPASSFVGVHDQEFWAHRTGADPDRRFAIDVRWFKCWRRPVVVVPPVMNTLVAGNGDVRQVSTGSPVLSMVQKAPSRLHRSSRAAGLECASDYLRAHPQRRKSVATQVLRCCFATGHRQDQ